MNRVIKMLALAALIGVTGDASAAIIPVPNFSFESPAVATFNGPGPGSITGWTSLQGGVFNPTGTAAANAIPPTFFFNAGFPTNGLQSAYANGDSITNAASLGTIVATDYVLNVDVGRRKDFSFPAYSIHILANGARVASVTGPTPASGDWVTASVTLTAANAAAFAGQALGIELAHDGGGTQVNFDNVRLSDSLAGPVPEPASLCIWGGVGIAGLIATRRRKRMQASKA